MTLQSSALIAAVIITVLSQLALKISTNNSQKKLNTFLVAGLAGLGIVTILAVLALQTIDLKTLMACMALTYILTPLAARLVLGEPFTRRQLSGSIFIALGVIVFFSGG